MAFQVRDTRWTRVRMDQSGTKSMMVSSNVNDGEADQMGKRITTQAVSDLRRLVPDLLRV